MPQRSAASCMSVQVYSNFDALPERVTAFAGAAAQGDFFRGLAWFRVVLTTAVPAGSAPRIYVAERNDRPVVALFASERRRAGRLKAHMLLGAGQGPYGATYHPVLDDEHGPAGLREIAAALSSASPAFDVLRFDGLDPRAHDYAALVAAFRASGLIVQCFANPENWSEDVGGLSFAQYLARRPAHIRSIAHGCLGSTDVCGLRFELVSDGAALATPLIDYALVDLQSGAPPEIYPDCIPETARAAARQGLLRFGLLYVEDRPVAAQIWIVSGGKATQLRERHVAGFAGPPIQIALTAAVLSRLFETHPVNSIEFSRDSGDAAPDWLGCRQTRAGIVVITPRTVRGLLAAARHIGGHWVMTAARRAGAITRCVESG
jgi:hypothetical protein